MIPINLNKISETIKSLEILPPDQEKKTLEVILHTPGYIQRFLPRNDKTVQTGFISYLFQRLEQTLKDQSKTDVAELYKKGLKVCVCYAKEFFNASSTFFGESSSIELLKKTFTCRFGTKEIKLPLALLQIYKIDFIFNSTLSMLREGQQSEISFEEYGEKTAELFEQFIRTQTFNISINEATYDDIIELLHLHTFSNYCQFEELEQYTADTLITILSTASNTVYWRDEVVQQVLSSNSRMCFEVLKKYLKNVNLCFAEDQTKIYVDPRALVLLELPCMRFHIGGIYIQSFEEMPDIIEALKTVIDTDGFKNQIQKLYHPSYSPIGQDRRSLNDGGVDVISKLFPLLSRLSNNLGPSLVSFPILPVDAIDKTILQPMKEKSTGVYQRAFAYIMYPFAVSFLKQFLEFIDKENMILDNKCPYHQKIVALLFSRVLSERQNGPELIRIKEINDLMIQEETEYNLLNRFLLKKYELLTEVLNIEETHPLNTIKISQLLKDLSSFVQFDNDIFNILIYNRLYNKVAQLSNKSEKFKFFEQIKQYLNTYIKLSLKEDPKYKRANFHIGQILFTQSSIVENVDKLELLQQTQEAYQRVLEIDSNHLQAIYNLGSALFEQAKIVSDEDKSGLLQQGQNFLQKALKINPNDINVHFLMGKILIERAKVASKEHFFGLLQQAQNCFQKMLEINPNNINAQRNLVVILFEQGKFLFSQAVNTNVNETRKLELLKQAQEAYQKVLEIDQKYLNAYFHMGSILYERVKIASDADRFGLLQQTQNCFQKILEIDSNNIGAKQSLKFILHQQGKILFSQAVNRTVNETRKLELLKQAQETVQKILEIDPNDTGAAKLMDNIVLEQKKIIQAEATDASKKRKRNDNDTDDTSASKRSKV